MSDNLNKIGMLTDRLDNLIKALELPIPAKMHVEIIERILPDIRDDIRKAIIAESGENPWKTFHSDPYDDDNEA